MIPKDPVYTLHEAVERVKDTFPDVDAEGWLKDQIAADRITWGYIWNENQHDGWPPVIDILPRAHAVLLLRQDSGIPDERANGARRGREVA